MIRDLKKTIIFSTPDERRGTIFNDLRFTKRLLFLLREYFQTSSKAEQNHRPKDWPGPSEIVGSLLSFVLDETCLSNISLQTNEWSKTIQILEYQTDMRRCRFDKPSSLLRPYIADTSALPMSELGLLPVVTTMGIPTTEDSKQRVPGWQARLSNCW